jgi:hypothetical protein
MGQLLCEKVVAAEDEEETVSPDALKAWNVSLHATSILDLNHSDSVVTG